MLVMPGMRPASQTTNQPTNPPITARVRKKPVSKKNTSTVRFIGIAWFRGSGFCTLQCSVKRWDYICKGFFVRRVWDVDRFGDELLAFTAKMQGDFIFGRQAHCRNSRLGCLLTSCDIDIIFADCLMCAGKPRGPGGSPISRLRIPRRPLPHGAARGGAGWGGFVVGSSGRLVAWLLGRWAAGLFGSLGRCVGPWDRWVTRPLGCSVVGPLDR